MDCQVTWVGKQLNNSCNLTLYFVLLFHVGCSKTKQNKTKQGPNLLLFVHLMIFGHLYLTISLATEELEGKKLNGLACLTGVVWLMLYVHPKK